MMASAARALRSWPQGFGLGTIARARSAGSARDVSDYLPCVITPLLILAIAGLASLGTERPLLHAAVALLAAAVSGVLQAWAISRVRAYADERVHQTHEMVEEHADARVTAVARQFTWAVADTARLSHELRKAKAEKAMALAGSAAMHRRVGELESLLDEAVARLGALSEREAGLFGAAIKGGELEAVELFWGIHDNGVIRWLQVEGGNWATVPSRVRVLDDGGRIIAVSYRSLASRIDGIAPLGAGGRLGLASMIFQVPDHVLNALCDRLEGYRFEALVHDEWWPAKMIDTGSRSGATDLAQRNGVEIVGEDAATLDQLALALQPRDEPMHPSTAERRSANLIARRDPRAASVALEAAEWHLLEGRTNAASDLLLQLISSGLADHDAQLLLVDVVRSVGKRDVAREKCTLLAQALRLRGNEKLAVQVARLAEAV